MKFQGQRAAPDIELAVEHHRAGRLQQAEAIYKQLPFNPDALHLRGLIAQQMHRNEEAVELIGKAILAMPSYAPFYYSIDSAYRALNRLDEVVSSYQRLLKKIPGDATAHSNLGNAFKDLGKLDEAVACYRQALVFDPNLFIAHSNLGIVLQALGKLDEAVVSYQRALALKPDLAEAHNNLGTVFAAQGNQEDAISCYRKALALKPDFAVAHVNLGIALKVQGKLDEAVQCCQHALILDPNCADALTHLGNIRTQQGTLDDAIACYLKSLEINPNSADTHSFLGNALKNQGNLDDAVICYQNAIALKSNFADAHNNLGVIFKQQGRLNEAVTSYLNAIAIKPDYAEAYNNLGLAFAEQGDQNAAYQCYQTALALNANLAEVNNNFGVALKERGELNEAMAYYHKALAIKPDFPDAHTNLGISLKDQGNLDEAIACYRRALAHKPDYANAHYSLLLALQHSATHPPEEVFSEHLRYAAQFEAPHKSRWAPHANPRDPHKRLKIGYVSPDFRKHAVAYSIEPVLACHDKAAVEVFCYYNHTHVDAVTQRLQALADHWIPCKHLSDDQLAERIRADGIDILIDLAGHTGGNRLLTFARKPAPVQVTYLGYPSTTGLSAIDYRLTDAHAEPPGMTEALNVEQLWRLPDMYCCYRALNNSTAVIDHPPAQDNGYVTFGCFNNFSKVTDPVLALWALLLQQVPTARLMLEIAGLDDAAFRSALEQRLVRLGLPLERMLLVPRKPENQYVLYNQIDIALDPFPCNGGTTSLDALWMGVPFITLAGRHFTSRMGVTILTNAGLPQLIAQSEDEYAAIAAALAGDMERLSAVRAGLRERVQASPLMDAARLTVNLELAYRAMWQTWCKNNQNEGGVA